MHSNSAFVLEAFNAFNLVYFNLPFWMFIDLRGPTLKTLHACTGVSTGKNEQRRRPLEMLQQAMVFIDSSHSFDKWRAKKYFAKTVLPN